MNDETELRRRQQLLAYSQWHAKTAELYVPTCVYYVDAQRAAWLELDDEQRQLILERYDACDPRARDRL